MTMIWQDGFDLYSTRSDLTLYYQNSQGSIQTTGGRFGGGCFETTGGQTGMWRTFGNETEVWLGFAMKTSSVASLDYCIAQFYTEYASNGGVENSITYNPLNGSWKIYDGYLNSVIATGTAQLTPGWHWIDIRLSRSATGAAEVWVDDMRIINFSGNTAKWGSSYHMIGFSIGDCYGPYTVDMLVDDLFVYTPGTRLGDSRIETVVPTSDAGPNNGTPSTGTSHYAVVDEAQYNTADYITMPNTVGDRELFGHGSIASTPILIHSVGVKLVVEKSDAGAYTIAPLVKSGSTSLGGTNVNITTSWTVIGSFWETDPNTSAAWTLSAANASDVGYLVP